MSEKRGMGRLDFLKGLGIAGVGAVIPTGGCRDEAGPAAGPAGPAEGPRKVPRRVLGRTGVRIPVLGHGIMYDLVDNQSVLYKGLQWGINFWDTSHSYAGGNSELGIGKFLKKNPGQRRNLFIVSKASGASTPAEIEECLQTSLRRMNTSYIDLYYGVHGLSDPSRLNDSLRRWAAGAKKRKLIRHFGFSTHKNMAPCLQAAARLDWIDALMTSYNFRLMQDADMQDAVEACHRKGIGIIAMKLLALRIRTEGDQKLVRHFLGRGFTDGQAKLKAVLEDRRISALCVSMPGNALVSTNASAVLDRKLNAGELDFLREYADSSRDGYCLGCAEICDGAAPHTPVVSDVLRYLMYFNNYGEEEKARRLFAELPATTRRRLTRTDFAEVEAVCPQRLPVSALMTEALEKLS